jgi:hypothetical protein
MSVSPRRPSHYRPCWPYYHMRRPPGNHAEIISEMKDCVNSARVKLREEPDEQPGDPAPGNTGPAARSLPDGPDRLGHRRPDGRPASPWQQPVGTRPTSPDRARTARRANRARWATKTTIHPVAATSAITVSAAGAGRVASDRGRLRPDPADARFAPALHRAALGTHRRETQLASSGGHRLDAHKMSGRIRKIDPTEKRLDLGVEHE